jgi:hypothetical protein
MRTLSPFFFFLGKTGSISEKMCEWDKELQYDKDRTFLLEGIKSGFRITERGSEFLSVQLTNHPSAFQHRKEVEKELRKQVELGLKIRTIKRER